MHWWSPDAVRHLFQTSTSLGEMVARSVLVYVFLVIVLRLVGKRLLAQLNPFDFVVLLILSNTLQNAILGDDDSVLGGVVRASALLLFNHLFIRFDVWLNDRAQGGAVMFLERAVDGSSQPLIEDGSVIDSVRRSEGITSNQLRAALHRQGVRSLDDVKSAQLEPGGVLYVERQDRMSDAEWREDLVTRLTRIEEMLASRG